MDNVSFEPQRIVVDRGAPEPYKFDVDNMVIVLGAENEDQLDDDESVQLFYYEFMENPDGGDYGLDVFVDMLELEEENKNVWYVWDLGDVFRHVRDTKGEQAAMIIHTIKYYSVASWIASRLELAQRKYEFVMHDFVAMGDQDIEVLFELIAGNSDEE